MVVLRTALELVLELNRQLHIYLLSSSYHHSDGQD